MSNLNKIIELDNSIFEEFKIYFSKIQASNFSKHYPTTLQLSNLFTTSTNFIKESVFNCCESDDLYGTKILFRSLIEHYLRFQLIWFNWVKTQSDTEAKKYLDFTAAREVLDYIKAEIDAFKLSKADFKVADWEELLSKFPSCKNLSKREIEEETLKYTYKNIIKSLKETAKSGNSLFTKLIIEYSKLSSFVHGGSGSHQEFLMYRNLSKRKEEYNRICGLSFQMAAAVKLFSLRMLAQTDRDKFESSYLKVDKIIKSL